jgi:hypothetical protein
MAISWHHPFNIGDDVTIGGGDNRYRVLAFDFWRQDAILEGFGPININRIQHPTMKGAHHP